jgi:membrane protease YdiL (CAAX protease family)
MNLPMQRSMSRTSLRSHLLAVLLTLAVVFAATRAVGTLGPAAWRWLLPAGFACMALTPWLLLDAAGRRRIGLAPAGPRRWYWYGLALAGGAVLALACFGVGLLAFGDSSNHWYVSIAGSYQRTMDTRSLPLWALYLIFTLPALIFSPTGEEIFFRGMLQQALQDKLSAPLATTLECSLFAVVHLCHHGVLWTATGLGWTPLSALPWMALMFGTAWCFAWLRQRSGSLYPAIVAHMAFNAMMNATIFCCLWPPGVAAG